MILITGATGNVGREALGLLSGRGREVVAVTRDPAGAPPLGRARVVGGDPSRPETLRPVLTGVESILISPRAVSGAVPELLALAAEHGVRRVVLLSAATVAHPAGDPRFVEEFKVVEDAVRDSGLEWTILRCTDFDSNSLAWAPQIRTTGIVRGAYATAVTSPIHERDVAAVAVAAIESDHAGQTYLLTGPQPLSQLDKVRIIGEAIWEPLSFQELPPDVVRQAMLGQGLPAEIPDRLLGSLADYAERPGPSSDTVEQILGRPALTFADWAADHAAAFRN